MTPEEKLKALRNELLFVGEAVENGTYKITRDHMMDYVTRLETARWVICPKANKCDYKGLVCFGHYEKHAQTEQCKKQGNCPACIPYTPKRRIRK